MVNGGLLVREDPNNPGGLLVHLDDDEITATRQGAFDRWDDFSRADGQLSASDSGKLPSGQTWQLGFASPAVSADLQIVSNALRLQAAGASYLWTTGSTPPSGATIEFSYDEGSTPNATVGLIFSKLTGPAVSGATGVATNSVHCSFGPENWSVGIFNGVSLSIISNGTYTSIADGTRKRASVRRIGPDRLEVNTPDGVTRVIRDRRIPQWWGSTVLIEHYQPSATFATDARPVILGYWVHQPTARAMPLDLPVGGVAVGGIPGGIPFVSGAVAFTADITRYTPMEVTDPITITNAYCEVTTVSTAGGLMRAAIFEADESWQPKQLLLDLGTKVTDALAVQGWTGLSLGLSRGRYLLGWRCSAAVSCRYVGYSTPGAGGIRASTMGATPFAQALQVSQAFGAFADPGTAWNTAAAAGNTGWITPVLLTWTGA